jgi:hypothetical protein
MSRSAPTLPFATISAEPIRRRRRRRRHFTLSNGGWAAIEMVYGHPLSAAVRTLIYRATANFVLFEPFERVVAPVSEARDRIRSVKKAAEAFFHSLNVPSPDATVFADNLVDIYFHQSRHGSAGDLKQLSDVLISVACACNSALQELDNFAGHRDGECWNRWIRELTKILEDANCPTGVSKSGQATPFQRLVTKLQECIPGEARRHIGPTVTTMAAAAAILRAREVDGTQ